MENIDEIWVPIKGYEGSYEVSNTGFVRSLDRLVKGKHNNFQKIKGQIMKGYLNWRGYRNIPLCVGRKSKGVLISRLIAIHFIENPENKPQVNHKDGNKLNNHVNNLEWVTPLENMKHAVGSGLIGRGKDRYNCKLSESIVFDIRYNLSKTHSQRKIAKIFNVSLASINSVIKYKSWKHVQKDCQL